VGVQHLLRIVSIGASLAAVATRLQQIAQRVEHRAIAASPRRARAREGLVLQSHADSSW